MKRCAFIFVLLFSAALVCAGCSGMPNRAKIQFEGNRTVGDDWRCIVAPDGIVEVSNRYRMILPLPGMGGTFTFNFKAVAEGEAEVFLINNWRGLSIRAIIYTAVVDKRKRLTLTETDSFSVDSDDVLVSRALYDSGVKAYHEDDYDTALDNLSEAIRINPFNGDALYMRGVVYYKMDDFANARPDFEMALRISPLFTRTYLDEIITLQGN